MPVYKNEQTKKYYFIVWYQDINGKRKQKKKSGFTLARDAKAAEQEFLKRYTGTSNITFKTLCTYYIDDSKVRIKETSLATKVYTINKILIPALGDYNINDITIQMIRQLQNQWIQKYKPTSQRRIHAQLSAIFNYAIKFHGLKSNPARDVGTIGSLKTNMPFWTREQFNQFIYALDNQKRNPQRKHVDYYFYHVAFILLFYTGLRIGELLALTVADIDFSTNTLYVNKTLARIGSRTKIQTPKTEKSNRTVVLPGSIASIMKEFINRFYEPNRNEVLFPMSYLCMQRTLKLYTDIAGLPAIGLHCLRHSHVAMLINMNCNPLYISQRLGHKDITTTLNKYGHLYNTQAIEIANKIDKLFKCT